MIIDIVILTRQTFISNLLNSNIFLHFKLGCMNTKANKVRYAFVKNGDVVKQLMRITQHHVGELQVVLMLFLQIFYEMFHTAPFLWLGTDQ